MKFWLVWLTLNSAILLSWHFTHDAIGTMLYLIVVDGGCIVWLIYDLKRSMLNALHDYQRTKEQV